MLNKILNGIRPRTFLDYIFALALIWNFSPFIVGAVWSILPEPPTWVFNLLSLTTIHISPFVPKNAELEGILYFFWVPALIAVFINILALALKSRFKNVNPPFVLTTTLVLVALSFISTAFSLFISGAKSNELYMQRKELGKQLSMQLVDCKEVSGLKDKKQFECKFLLSNIPTKKDPEPQVEIFIKSDNQAQEGPQEAITVHLTEESNNTFEGSFVVGAQSQLDFESLYIYYFDYIDGFDRFPSSETKIYLAR